MSISEIPLFKITNEDLNALKNLVKAEIMIKRQWLEHGQIELPPIPDVIAQDYEGALKRAKIEYWAYKVFLSNHFGARMILELQAKEMGISDEYVHTLVEGVMRRVFLSLNNS